MFKQKQQFLLDNGWTYWRGDFWTHPEFKQENEYIVFTAEQAYYLATNE